jgi:hypothetical protein
MRDSTGLPCPDCGTELHDVRETRKRGGTIYRRRECFNGHKFSTVEIVAPGTGGLDVATFALDRVIASEQARVEALRSANPDDLYCGLMVLEDIELLKQAREFVAAAGQPEGIEEPATESSND